MDPVDEGRFLEGRRQLLEDPVTLVQRKAVHPKSDVPRHDETRFGGAEISGGHSVAPAFQLHLRGGRLYLLDLVDDHDVVARDEPDLLRIAVEKQRRRGELSPGNDRRVAADVIEYEGFAGSPGRKMIVKVIAGSWVSCLR